MNRILALDPGTEKSGWATVCRKTGRIHDSGTELNLEALARIARHRGPVAIEQMQEQGRGVLGKTTVWAMLWSGRFWEVADRQGNIVIWIPRSTAKSQAGAHPSDDDAGLARALRRNHGDCGERDCGAGCQSKACPLRRTDTHRRAAMAVGIAAHRKLKP